jgi:hypothetical protein
MKHLKPSHYLVKIALLNLIRMPRRDGVVAIIQLILVKNNISTVN